MKYDPQRHHRRSIRLKGYDYAQAGAYFVTICAQDGQSLFGEVVDGEMILSPAGEMVADIWQAIPDKFPTALLDAFAVMPNHIHFVVFLTNEPRPAESDTQAIVGADPRVRPAPEPTSASGERLSAAGGQTAPAAEGQTAPAAEGQTAPAAEGQTRGSAPTVDANVVESVGDGGEMAPVERPTLSRIVQWLKSLTTARYRHGVRDQGWPAFPGRVWQRNYYEHIIRDERSLTKIREYIQGNPAAWMGDQLHPDAPLNPFNASWNRNPTSREKEKANLD